MVKRPDVNALELKVNPSSLRDNTSRVVAGSIKNVIFDLGGVIIDLDIPATLQAFSRLSGKSHDQITAIFHSAPEFLLFETGEVDDQQFRDFVRRAFELTASDEQIDFCWNAMLVGIPQDKLKLIAGLKGGFRTFLLSNTNSIHLKHINDVTLRESTGENDLDQYFHRAYYSHQMGLRKPDTGIYQRVLDENGLRADETLFLDDNLSNVEAANRLGIQTVYVTNTQTIFDVFTK